MKDRLITAYVDYIQGYIKSGYYECVIPEDEYNKIKDNENALKQYVRNNGEILITDFGIDDIGDISEINVC